MRVVGGEVQPVQVVLESTTNSRAIQRMIKHCGEQAGFMMSVDVLDARKLRIIARERLQVRRTRRAGA